MTSPMEPQMMAAFVLTLLLIIIGDAVTMALDIPVPGAVFGLLVMAALFAARGGPTPAMSRMFDLIIPHAPMLFVPAGAGVIANADLIAARWLPIVSVITLSTFVVLLVAGLTAQALVRMFCSRQSAS
jgi:holin-like protein